MESVIRNPIAGLWRHLKINLCPRPGVWAAGRGALPGGGEPSWWPCLPTPVAICPAACGLPSGLAAGCVSGKWSVHLASLPAWHSVRPSPPGPRAAEMLEDPSHSCSTAETGQPSQAISAGAGGQLESERPVVSRRKGADCPKVKETWVGADLKPRPPVLHPFLASFLRAFLS